MKYFGDSYRLQHAANLFEKLVDKEPEVAALLAKSYIGMSEHFLFGMGRPDLAKLLLKHQTRRSRRSRSFLLRFTRTRNRTISSTRNATFYETRAKPNGH